MKKTNFTWSCEINGATTTTITSGTISHNCAKISHDHTKSTCKFSLACSTNPSSGPFITVMRICNIWFLNFPLSFFLFPYFNFTLTTSNPDPNQLHYFFHYTFRSSSTLFVLFNSIHLFCHQFIKINTLKWLQNFIKLVSNYCKDNNILIGYFRHNYYSTDVNFMRIIT